MKVAFEELIPTSRVWIYQSKEKLTAEHEETIQEKLNMFVTQWNSHNEPVAGGFKIYHNRFITLVADESHNPLGGCSIDTSIAFMHALEQSHGLSLFDRMTFSYKKNGEVIAVPSTRFRELYQSGEIDDHTTVFDNLIKTKSELAEGWLKPLGQSWHKRFV